MNLIEEMLRAVLTQNNVEVEHLDSLGLRASMGDIFSGTHEGNFHRTYLDVHVEAELPSSPTNSDLGYTTEEVSFRRGITLAAVEDKTDPPQYFGEVFEPETFLAAYVGDEKLIDSTLDAIKTMEDKINPREKYLISATNAYHNRMLGASGTYAERVIC